MIMLTRCIYLLIVFLWSVSTLYAASERPNILWIFSDDHTRQAIGAYGSRLAELNPTPNIDRIAKGGIRFDRCYVGNSICAPSRATLLTGKHSHLHGKMNNMGGFDQDQQTFPKLLQKAGYHTAMIGKIHLPGKMQGFDYWEVLPGQGSYYQPTFMTEEGQTQYKGYVTEIITERALNWLNESRTEDKPWMLMVHHKATHRTWCSGPRQLKMFEGVHIPEPDNLFDDYASRTTAARSQDMTIAKTMRLSVDLKVKTEEEKQAGIARYAKSKSLPSGEPGAYYRMRPEHREQWDAVYDPENAEYFDKKLSGKDEVRWRYQRYVRDYLRAGAGIDESVGQLLDYLDEHGLSKNTIVFYSSDQGFYLGEHGWFDKRFMYEESFSTPLLAMWPGKIKPGSVNSDLVQNIDFAETFLDLAGAPIPDDMQGKSLVPLLKGQAPSDWRESLYYHYYEYPGGHSVRRHEGVAGKRFKLIKFYGRDVPNGEEFELYDLQNDPSEMNNLYSNPEYSAQVEELKAELATLREHYQVPKNDSGEKKKRSKAQLEKIPLSKVLEEPDGKQITFANFDPSMTTLTLGARLDPGVSSGVVLAHGGQRIGYVLYLDKGKVKFAMRSDEELVQVAASKPLNPSEATHLVATLDAELKLNLYVNGEKQASAPAGFLISDNPRDVLSVAQDIGSNVIDYGDISGIHTGLSDVRVYKGSMPDAAIAAWATEALKK